MVTELGRATRPWVVDPREKAVLFEDRFDAVSGMGGWGGLISSGVVERYPYLRYPGYSGPWSMVLDTMGGSTSITASAIKRLQAQEGLFVWKSKIAWSAANNNFLRYHRFVMDYEDEEFRYWFEFRYRHFDEAVSSMEPRWQVQTGTGSATTYADSSVTTQLPYNQEDKLNFADITIGFNTEAKRYEFLEINGIRHDMTGATVPAAGPKIDPPGTFFTHGMNPLFRTVGRSNNSSADPRLYVGYTAGAMLNA